MLELHPHPAGPQTPTLGLTGLLHPARCQGLSSIIKSKESHKSIQICGSFHRFPYGKVLQGSSCSLKTPALAGFSQ